MATELTLNAETRHDVGKGASRRLRREADKIPGIVYGANKEPIPITLQHNEVLRLLEHEAAYSQIFTLALDNNAEQVVLRNLQRHIYKPKIQHLDLMRVSATQKLTMHIPIHFIGEDKAPGVTAGGVVSHNMIEVEVSCLPKDLPEFFAVDVSQLKLDEAIHLSALNIPEGVELTTQITEEYDPAMVSVHIPKEEPVEEPESTEGEKTEEGAAAEGEAKATAEGEAKDEKASDVSDGKQKPAEKDQSDKSE